MDNWTKTRAVLHAAVAQGSLSLAALRAAILIDQGPDQEKAIIAFGPNAPRWKIDSSSDFLTGHPTTYTVALPEGVWVDYDETTESLQQAYATAGQAWHAARG